MHILNFLHKYPAEDVVFYLGVNRHLEALRRGQLFSNDPLKMLLEFRIPIIAKRNRKTNDRRLTHPNIGSQSGCCKKGRLIEVADDVVGNLNLLLRQVETVLLHLVEKSDFVCD